MNVPKRRLLLADDSITIQKVVNLTFAEEGIEVSVVSDGDAALDHLSRERPDLVMADVNMPGANGYQVCEAVRANESTRDIPVVLLVGSFEPFDEAEAERVGANAFMTKPFQSIRQLVVSITEMMDASAAVTDNAFESQTGDTAPPITDEAAYPEPESSVEAPETVEYRDEIEDLYVQSVTPASGDAAQSNEYSFTGDELDDEMIETSYTETDSVDFALPERAEGEGLENASYDDTAEPDTSQYYSETSTTDETVELPAHKVPYYGESISEELPTEGPVSDKAAGSYYAYDTTPDLGTPEPVEDLSGLDARPESSNVTPIDRGFAIADTQTSATEETSPVVEQFPAHHVSPFESKAEPEVLFDQSVASTAVDLPPPSFFEQVDLLDLPPAADNQTIEFTTPVLADDVGSNKQVVSVSPELMEIIVQKVLERLRQQ